MPDKFLNRPVVSIPALIAESASRWPHQPALWRLGASSSDSMCYGGLVGGIASLARQLAAQGSKPGARVAIRVTDRLQFGIAQLAALWTGATVVPLDPVLTPPEVSAILVESGAGLFITDGPNAPEEGPPLKTVKLAQYWPEFPVGGTLHTPTAIDPDSAAIILFTSGTTGYSKGVTLTHANIVTDIMAIQEMRLLDPSDKLLSVLPIHHAFELTAGFLYPLSIGAQVAYARSLKSNEIIEDLRNSRATVILGVPLLWEKMAAGIVRKVRESSAVRRFAFGFLSSLSRAGQGIGWRQSSRALFRSIREKGGLGSLRFVVSGGAALPGHVAKFFDTFGLPIIQGYGLSEASPVVTVNRPGRHRPETVGPPLPGVEVRIDSAVDGVGEIAVRGPMVMQGYWKKPDETAAVLRDGWLLTGDLGRIDRSGHLRIVGRSKNLIISGAGKNIYPEEIESVLNAQPGVEESMVYGKTREGKTGELVAAVIVPNREWLAENQPEVLRDRAALESAFSQVVKNTNQLMAPYKHIAEWTLRDEPFEKTSTRKIKRKVAMAQLRQSESAESASPIG